MDEKMLGDIRAQIARKGLKKADLAKKCNMSRSYFSERIWGYREFPPRALAILLRELELDAYLESL